MTKQKDGTVVTAKARGKPITLAQQLARKKLKLFSYEYMYPTCFQRNTGNTAGLKSLTPVPKTEAEQKKDRFAKMNLAECQKECSLNDDCIAIEKHGCDKFIEGCDIARCDLLAFGSLADTLADSLYPILPASLALLGTKDPCNPPKPGEQAKIRAYLKRESGFVPLAKSRVLTANELPPGVDPNDPQDGKRVRLRAAGEIAPGRREGGERAPPGRGSE